MSWHSAPESARRARSGKLSRSSWSSPSNRSSLDADGLNALAALTSDPFKRRQAPTVLTPHPGEFARLLKTSVSEVQANRQELAVHFAAERNVVLVLKGHETIVTDGERLYVNGTGNPGMATGGTGDVLTGLIAALIGAKTAAI